MARYVKHFHYFCHHKISHLSTSRQISTEGACCYTNRFTLARHRTEVSAPTPTPTVQIWLFIKCTPSRFLNHMLKSLRSFKESSQ